MNLQLPTAQPGGLLLGLFGVGQIGGTLAITIQNGAGSPILLGSFPLAIGISILTVAYWLREDRRDDPLSRVVNPWSVAGFFGILLLTVYFTIAAEFIPPSNQVPKSYVLLVTIGSGILYGAILGIYVHRSTQQQAALRAQKEKLDRQVAHLEKFASFVSHDLRNPLNVAAGRLDHARREDDSEHLAEVARAHDRMERLIDDLLLLTRVGTTDVETEPTSLTPRAERAWSDVDTQDAELEIDSNTVVEANANLLEQLLMNLIRNAVEHGGTGVTVSVGALDDGFYVEDDGAGLPEDASSELFESGFSTDDRGTGLGLTIVRDISNAHGWEVGVTASDDGGARFTITGATSEGL